MASYAPLTMFSPSAARYENPSQYAEAARTEAVKQASYLSQMDQFYTSLDESKRQFDVGLAAQKEMFGTEMEFKEKGLTWEKERFGKELGFKETELGQQESQFARELGFKETSLAEQLKLEREQLAQQESQFARDFGLQQTESNYMLQLYNKLYSDERLKVQDKLANLNLQTAEYAYKQLTTPRYTTVPSLNSYFSKTIVDPDWQQTVDSWLTGTPQAQSTSQAWSMPTISAPSSPSSGSSKSSTPTTTDYWSSGSFDADSPWGGFSEQIADFRARSDSGGFI